MKIATTVQTLYDARKQQTGYVIAQIIDKEVDNGVEITVVYFSAKKEGNEYVQGEYLTQSKPKTISDAELLPYYQSAKANANANENALKAIKDIEEEALFNWFINQPLYDDNGKEVKNETEYGLAKNQWIIIPN